MNNGGLPGKPAKLSVSPGDDIPEAMRDTPDVKRRYPLKPILLISGILGLGVIALLIGVLVAQPKPQPTVVSSPTPKSDNNQTPGSDAERLLGHFPYPEAPALELQSITPDGQLQLRKAAAQKYQEMSSVASQAGVILAPLSGFRSVSDQQHVFFDVKAERGQVTTKRAEVSAPPGYSEHHTGYAIDIGDGNTPATNLSPDFDKTATFQWLEKNAGFYSFEMSFPKNNSQGVTYEPWHWRFVGDRDSLETFYRAKKLTRPAATPSTIPTTMPSSTPTATTSPTPAAMPSTTPSPTPAVTPSATPSSTP